MSKEYKPETYWSEVAERIDSRGEQNVVAGDDEPYYRYKRRKFIALLNSVNFKGKSVLEIGNGPGGNLKEVWKHNPARLVGVDISAPMVELAKKNNAKEVEIYKINGIELPFEDKTFDIVFTATVLQHNTDEVMLKSIMKELSRVSKDRVYLFERIEATIYGDELCYGRPVSYYADIMKQNGFELVKTEFINIRASYYVSGSIRKLLNPKTRQEGEPLNNASLLLQNISLPFTKILDKIFTSKKDIGKLEFRRIS